MFTIFIVEDDHKLGTLLQKQFEKYGYRAVTARCFHDILAEFQDINPHLVVMDVNLPRFDGFYWCRQIRAVSNCPILFLSARDSSMDQVMAIENGADDYMTKPFHYELALAKVKSLLRRVYGSYAQGMRNERTIELSGLILYPERLLLSFKNQTAELSHTESKLLQELMERSGRVVSRDRLLERIWDDQNFIDDNTLSVYVARVRKKLKDLGLEDSIDTVRGVGYMLKSVWGENA
ncbi:response regulator transcription factor [Ectobacillus ponti]|uniref:Response regulator transcription factor n=1 Tax=Ectobacillus ponti TaxID=2961894 RepID=A0AA41XAM7_9BACI|nr:response regulator transcription factor [Ectobacillus ponti]MCP8969338.1 response regulator transcription factor [Ectobacillus ponti]